MPEKLLSMMMQKANAGYFRNPQDQDRVAAEMEPSPVPHFLL